MLIKKYKQKNKKMKLKWMIKNQLKKKKEIENILIVDDKKDKILPSKSTK